MDVIFGGGFCLGILVSFMLRVVVMGWSGQDVLIEFVGVLAVILFTIGGLVWNDKRREKRHREWAEALTRQSQQRSSLH